MTFKILVAATLPLVFASQVFAAQRTKQSGESSMSMSKFQEVAAPSEVYGVTVFGIYDNADKFKGDFSGGGLATSETTNAESTFGIGAEYAQYTPRFVGFYANGAYEFGRSWKSADINGGNVQFNPKPTLTMFLVGAGGNYSINNNFYLKAGVNYNFPSLSSGGIFTDVTGKLGFEGGVGARFARNFNAEITYRRLAMTASGNAGGAFSIDNIQLNGFVLRGGYLF